MKKKVKWFVNVEMLIVNLRPNLQLRNIWHISRLPSQNLDAQMLNAKKFQHKQYYSFTNAPFYNSYVSLAILWCGSWIDSSVGPLREQHPKQSSCPSRYIQVVKLTAQEFMGKPTFGMSNKLTSCYIWKFQSAKEKNLSNYISLMLVVVPEV